MLFGLQDGAGLGMAGQGLCGIPVWPGDGVWWPGGCYSLMHVCPQTFDHVPYQSDQTGAPGSALMSDMRHAGPAYQPANLSRSI